AAVVTGIAAMADARYCAATVAKTTTASGYGSSGCRLIGPSTRDYAKAFQPRASRQILIERDDVQRLRPIARGEDGRTQLHRVRRGEGVNTHEAFGAASDLLDVCDGSPAPEEVHHLEAHAR